MWQPLSLLHATTASFPPGFSVGAGGGASQDGAWTLSTTYIGVHTLSAFGDDGSWSMPVVLDRSVAGIISVVAVAKTFTLHRRWIASAGAHARVLVNDTLRCTSSAQCPLYTNTTLRLESATASVTLNGGWDAPQLQECATNLVRGTSGNPSVVAAAFDGGGVGIMALDDVFRAHAYIEQRAIAGTIPGHAPCAVSLDAPAFDVVDPYLALGADQTYTAEWAVYSLESALGHADVKWAFANRLREDLGVNVVTLRGGATLASWETEILAAGNWTTPNCNMTPPARGAGSSMCFPAWSDDVLRDFVRYQGVERGHVISTIARQSTTWHKCGDPSAPVRDYCYGSCAVARQYSNVTADYYSRLVSSLKRIEYKGASLLYIHPFISNERNAAVKYATDRQLDASGAQVCDYAGEFIGTMHNAYGKQLLALVELAMTKPPHGLGFSGIYMDESSYGVTPLDYNPLHSDGHSAIIDRDTFSIVRNVSFVPLLFQELQSAMFSAVTERGGALVANSFPTTRTMMEASVANSVLHFVETSAKGREMWGWTSTPLGLAKALFQGGDPDPRYANVSGRPVDNLWADLDFGALTYYYDALLPNVSGWRGGSPSSPPLANIMQHLFPITPVELGPGWIAGSERVVTKASHDFTLKGAAHLVVTYWNREGWQTSTHGVAGSSVRIDVDGGGTRSFATITAPQ